MLSFEIFQNAESVIFQDLDWCDNIDTVGGSTRPLSVLYDSLVRPGADLGAQISSRLLWQTDQTRHIPHLVLGEAAVGGSWNSYDPEVSSTLYCLVPAFLGFVCGHAASRLLSARNIPACRSGSGFFLANNARWNLLARFRRCVNISRLFSPSISVDNGGKSEE